MDQIFIRDMEINTVIGVYEWERIQPQKILVNIVLYIDLSRAGWSDNVNDSIDYSVVAQKIKDHAETASKLTVEALASELAALCLEDARVQRVRVRVEKPQAVANSASVGVEIERS